MEQEIKNRSKAIFKYLEDLFQLAQKDPKRDIRNNSDIEVFLQLDDPTEVPNKSTNIKVRELDEDDTGAILTVQKVEIDEKPSTPDELKEWLEEVDNDFTKPKLKKSITIQQKFEDDQERTKAEQDFRSSDEGDISEILEPWVDNQILLEKGEIEFLKTKVRKLKLEEVPEIESKFEYYIEKIWQPWYEKNYFLYKGNQLFTKLYGLRSELKASQDTHDLVISTDLITGRVHGVEVYHPLIFKKIELDFDPLSKTIEIRESSEKTELDTSFLQGLNIPNIEDVNIYASELNRNHESFKHWNSIWLQRVAKQVISYIAPESEERISLYPDCKISIKKQVQAFYYPTVYLKKKGNNSWINYVKKIQENIEHESVNIPKFLQDLTGVNSGKTIEEENKVTHSLTDAELHFPLPWNEEQKKIAERVEVSNSVVVQGPPGTGKSHTIVNLVSRFLTQGKTVLVVSQKGQALKVLGEKFPSSIHALTMTVTGDRDIDTNPVHAANEINANLSNPVYTQEAIEKKRDELKRVRKDLAEVRDKIREFTRIDIDQHIDISGERFSPIEAAKYIRDNISGVWIQDSDSISFLTNCEISENDIDEYAYGQHSFNHKVKELEGLQLPEVNEIPEKEYLISIVNKIQELVLSKKMWDEAMSQRELQQTPPQVREILNKLLPQTEHLLQAYDSFDSGWEKEIFERYYQNKIEKEHWDNVMVELSDRVDILRELDQHLLSFEVEYPVTQTEKEIDHGIEKLTDYFSSSVPVFLKNITLPEVAKDILSNALVDENPIKDNDDLKILSRYIERHFLSEKLKRIIKRSFEEYQHVPELKGVQTRIYTDILNSLHRIKEYGQCVIKLKNDVSNLQEFSGQQDVNQNYEYSKKYVVIRELANLNLNKKDELEWLRKLIQSGLNWFHHVDLFQELLPIKTSQYLEKYPHEIKEILTNIDQQTQDDIEEFYTDLESLRKRQKEVLKWAFKRDLLSKHLPILTKTISEDPKFWEDLKSKKILSFEESWKIRQLDNWLTSLRGDTYQELQKSFDILQNTEQNLIKDLITLKAWFSQKGRVTTEQKAALVSYSQNIKRLGKGLGKNANRHRRNAQKDLEIGKDAVPVWIMPVNRVMESFPEPRAEMFDVVIFDEASQVGVQGLAIAYLGKKLIVVGDPEQISPTSFIREDDVHGIIAKDLVDIPHKDRYESKSSLFDLTSLYTETILLKEHFRCRKELIQFSNNLCYENKLKVLRYPQPKWRLDPTLEAIHVSGYESSNKTNEVEAEAIVEKILEISNDPAYDLRPDGQYKTRKTTIGVVSLLGDAQAKLIKEKILSRIPEEIIEERHIEVGDAYKFQGDERDIMLLSMVKAPSIEDPNKTIFPLSVNKKENTQRINVALSRARDKMILFHSVKVEDISNPDDLRLQILNYFVNHNEEILKGSLEDLEKLYQEGKASPFSYAVGKEIISRGFNVIPEFETGLNREGETEHGFRIDLVVQGENSRLAVECDGDRYHTLENYEEDFQRESILRRTGWVFWRISGSEYYRDPERSLEPLWEELESLKIYPINK